MARNLYEDEAYTSEEFSHFSNILQNGTSRIPICFCIDCSESMRWLTNPESDFIVTGTGYSDGSSVNHVQLRPGRVKKTKMDDLKKVLVRLIDGLRQNEMLREAALVSIVTFSRYANTAINFCEPASLDGRTTADMIRIGVDQTNIAEGIRLSLNKLETMAGNLEDAQIEAYKPVFILISDGLPTDEADAKKAVRVLQERSANNELSVFPIGIYMDAAGKKWLRQLREDQEIFTTDSDSDFRRVFEMIEDLIALKAPILSVDEEISSENPFTQVEEDIEVTAYGQTNNPEDLLQFFQFPDNI